MSKFLVLFFILLFATLSPKAQDILVKGVVQDSITLFPIGNATIINGTSKKSVMSDSSGFFRIEATPGDLLYAAAKSYQFDTLRYSLIFTDTISFILSPSGDVLPDVVVTGRYNKYQLDSIQRRQVFEDMIGSRLKTLSTSHPSGFGLTFSLDKVFKKKYKNQERQEKVFNSLEKMVYIDYRFSPQVVEYYTSLKGEKLRAFMKQYTPSYEWLRQHSTNEDVLYYINEKLKEKKPRP